MDQEPWTEELASSWRTLLYTRHANAACALIRWPHFSAWNDVMAAVLKVWRHIGNPTLSIDAIYLKSIPVKFHPDLIW